MITNTPNTNFAENTVDLDDNHIINTQGIMHVNNREKKVCVANELLNTSTQYWDILPDELVEKIYTYLSARSLFACRASCQRNRRIVDSPLIGLQVKRNISLFAKTYTDNIPIKSMVNDFIIFIKKNNLVSEQELPKIEFLLNHFKYCGMQYVLAEISQNRKYSLNTVSVIHQNIFDIKTLPLKFMLLDNLIANENSNTYLYAIHNILYEIKAREGKVFISNTTKLNSIEDGACVAELFSYKQNVVISYYKDKNGIVFLHKINGYYYDITPKNLIDVSSSLIGMQNDAQGNNIFILHVENAVVCYYMPDHNSKLNATNIIDYEYECITISDKDFWIRNVIISEVNNLMIIYGDKRRSSSNNYQLEARIYKNNIQIYTYYFKYFTPYGFDQISNRCYCSPEGNYFTISTQDYNKNIRCIFYQVDDNQVREIGNFKHHSFNYDTEWIIYNNVGDMLLVPKGIMYEDFEKGIRTKLLYFTVENSIKKFNIPIYDRYKFNKSGCMFLGINYKLISIYNFQNKNCFQSITIKRKHKLSQAEFSPNSQLIVINEDYSSYQSTLVIYKIMTLDANNNLKILPKAEYIGEYKLCSRASFKFHPDGTELIVGLDDQIRILSIAP